MTPVQLADQPPLPLNQRLLGVIENVTPGYFSTLRIPLRRGRVFHERDILGFEFVAIIDENLARHFWPSYPHGLDPVGQQILIGANPQPVRIVGIVADVHQSLEVEPAPGVYRPYAQLPLSSAVFAVRTNGDPLRFANSIRSQVLAIDRDQPVSSVRTMDEVVEAEQGQRRLILMLLGLFAGTALVLTMVGIYGIIAYWVVQRTREIGIRRALGAQPGSILRLVVAQGLGVTLAGVVIGIAGALALTRVMVALLFQVSATDPVTFAGIPLLLVIMALLASYLPARRATRIDPVTALRMG